MAPSSDSPSALLRKKQTKSIASKTSKTTSSPRTPAKRPKIEDSGDDIPSAASEGPPAKKVARKTGHSTETPYPKTFDTMSKADRLLWDMRSKEISYDDITPRYQHAANLPLDIPIPNSTLPNRYSRLLDLFGPWHTTEDALLKRCEAAVAKIYADQKWVWIKHLMDAEGKGIKEYSRQRGVVGLKKRWAELVDQGGEVHEEEGDEEVSVVGQSRDGFSAGSGKRGEGRVIWGKVVGPGGGGGSGDEDDDEPRAYDVDKIIAETEEQARKERDARMASDGDDDDEDDDDDDDDDDTEDDDGAIAEKEDINDARSVKSALGLIALAK